VRAERGAVQQEGPRSQHPGGGQPREARARDHHVGAFGQRAGSTGGRGGGRAPAGREPGAPHRAGRARSNRMVPV